MIKPDLGEAFDGANLSVVEDDVLLVVIADFFRLRLLHDQVLGWLDDARLLLDDNGGGQDHDDLTVLENK